MLPGRLGLDSAHIRYADRHGLLWLDRGRLEIAAGCLRFATRGGLLPEGEYQISQQGLSVILLGPGSSVTHDALRILAHHGTALAAVGEGGVRLYTAPPLMSSTSALARRHAMLWANPRSRMAVARRMFALRMGEVVAAREIEMLRGMEGARVKEAYRKKAEEYGIEWNGRRYDRANPAAADLPNQAINHASSAIVAAAGIAVMATAAIPQLGFVHEDSNEAFVLDIADLYRDDVTLAIAFGAVKDAATSGLSLDKAVRVRANKTFASERIIPQMIERIQSMFAADA